MNVRATPEGVQARVTPEGVQAGATPEGVQAGATPGGGQARVTPEGGQAASSRPNFTLKDEVRAYWSDRASTFDLSASHRIEDRSGAPEWRRFLRAALELGPEGRLEGVRALDIACGTGEISRMLVSLGAEVTAVDFSPQMLERAEAKLGGAKLGGAKLAGGKPGDAGSGDAEPGDAEPGDAEPGDAEPAGARHGSARHGGAKHGGASWRGILADAEALYPLGNAEFDLAVTRHLAWTLTDPAAAYAEWRRVIAPGGRLVVVDGDWTVTPGPLLRLRRRLADALDGSGKAGSGDPHGMRSREDRARHEDIRARLPYSAGLSPERLEADLRAAGFTQMRRLSVRRLYGPGMAGVRLAERLRQTAAHRFAVVAR